MDNVCQECYMDVPPNRDGTAGFHPYLHCILWKHDGVDPVKTLALYGYERRAEVLDEVAKALEAERNAWMSATTSLAQYQSRGALLALTKVRSALGLVALDEQ